MIKIFFADNNLIGSRLIKLFTWSNYSHVGIICDEYVIDSRWANGGVTRYSVQELFNHYPRVTVFEVSSVPATAIDYAASQIGKPYDWAAIVGMPLHRDWAQDDKWFCSELVAAACMHAGQPIINKPVSRVTPQDLLEVMINNPTINNSPTAS